MQLTDDFTLFKEQLLIYRVTWQVAREYVDYVPGRKGGEKRLEFDRMLKTASQWQSILSTFGSLIGSAAEDRQDLSLLGFTRRLGVKFKSHTDEYLDTENKLVAHIFLGVPSYFAASSRPSPVLSPIRRRAPGRRQGGVEENRERRQPPRHTTMPMM